MNLRRTVAVTALIAFVVAACGTAAQVLAPELALREAAQATGNRQSATYTFTLAGSEEALNALLNEGQPPDSALSVLRRSRLAVSVEEAKGTRMALDLTLGDLQHAVEIRYLDGILYARADVEGIARLFGADPAAIAEVVAGAEGAGFGFLKDAVAGKWLSTDTKPFGDVLKGAEEGGAGLPQLGMDQVRNLMKAVGDTFGNEVKVDRVGKEDPGEHYRLTVPLRQVFQKLLPALMGAAGQVPPGLVPPAEAIPERDVSADVWLKGDRISRGELDLSQFADKPAGRVALRVDIDPLRQPVSAPKDAVAVNVVELLGRLAGLFTGALGG
jgi:hypothetical protein